MLVKDTLRLDHFWNMALFFVISLLYNFSVSTNFLKDYHPMTSLFDALRLILLSVAFTSFYGIYLLLPPLMANTIDTLQAMESSVRIATMALHRSRLRALSNNSSPGPTVGGGLRSSH